MDENTAAEPQPPLVPGLTDPRALPPERRPIRTRESGVTLSAWCLPVSCLEGEGAIVLLESAGQTHYRGDGVFLGWAQSRLEAAYRALVPAPEEERPIFGQLG